jgi:uncharacterized membrane protein
MRYIRTTILGGLIFLIPVGFVGFLLVQIYGVMQLIAQPIGRLVPLSNIGDIAIANVIAILLILGACFAAGLVAHHLPIGDRIARLDQRLSALVPAYSMAKGALAGATEDDRLELDWKPVMVGDPAGVERPGLEIERLASGRVVVFLPAAPSAQSGILQVVPAAQIRPLDMPPSRLARAHERFGRGLGAVIDAADISSLGKSD